MIGAWVQVILRALDARGVGGLALAKEAGIDVLAFADPEVRHSITATKRLWRLACEATEDPCFGLFVSGFVNYTTFQAVGAAVLASETLRDAFGRLVRHGRLVSDAGGFRLEEAGDAYRLIFDVIPGPSRPADEATDAYMSLQVRTARGLHGNRQLNPLTVELTRPKPSPSEPFFRFFRAPVTFSATANVLEFSRRDIEARLPAGNAALVRRIDDVLAHYVARLDQQQITSRIRAMIVERLPDGEPTQDAMARAFGLSARTLQRRLARAGSSYQEILNATREELACAYLAEGWSVTETAFALGFSDTSSFSRAFRRWAGCSPSQYGLRRP